MLLGRKFDPTASALGALTWHAQSRYLYKDRVEGAGSAVVPGARARRFVADAAKPAKIAHFEAVKLIMASCSAPSSRCCPPAACPAWPRGLGGSLPLWYAGWSAVNGCPRARLRPASEVRGSPHNSRAVGSAVRLSPQREAAEGTRGGSRLCAGKRIDRVHCNIYGSQVIKLLHVLSINYQWQRRPQRRLRRQLHALLPPPPPAPLPAVA